MRVSHYIGFVPPVVGVDGEFNTFRLGGFYRRALEAGQLVYLADEKAKQIIGLACVDHISSGQLSEMCVLYGAENHSNLVQHDDGLQPQERLYRLLQKLYGPHIATPSKLTTVIHLRRLE